MNKRQKDIKKLNDLGFTFQELTIRWDGDKNSIALIIYHNSIMIKEMTYEERFKSDSLPVDEFCYSVLRDIRLKELGI